MAPVSTTIPNDVSPGSATGSTPAPTKVDAYIPRSISSKEDSLGGGQLVLRVITFVCSLIAFATIASISGPQPVTIITNSLQFQINSVDIKFSDSFFFSYLLTVNVIVFVYSLGTLGLSIVSSKDSESSWQLFLFVMDQILSYLLMSASSSAATGFRAQKGLLSDFSDSFHSTSYASISFSFLAFFALATATLLSGWRVANRS